MSMKIVSFPIAVLSSNYEFEEELNKRIKAQHKLEAEGIESLNEAIDEGYTIVDSLETRVNQMVYLRYTLHKFDKPLIPPYES